MQLKLILVIPSELTLKITSLDIQLDQDLKILLVDMVTKYQMALIPSIFKNLQAPNYVSLWN